MLCSYAPRSQRSPSVPHFWMRFPLHPVYSVQNGAADRFIISPEVPFFNSRTEDFGVPASNRVCAGIRCGAGSPRHAGQSFFLYEKSVERESDFLRGRRPKVCTDLTPPLFRPSKALQIMGIQGESLPDAPPAAHLRIRRSRIPRCVVSRRTAERETASRGLALGFPLFLRAFEGRKRGG